MRLASSGEEGWEGWLEGMFAEGLEGCVLEYRYWTDRLGGCYVLGAAGEVRPADMERCEGSRLCTNSSACRSPEHHGRLLERNAAVRVWTLLYIGRVSDVCRVLW